jgi:glycosyltransferase involved in cell wall biosynthesis
MNKILQSILFQIKYDTFSAWKGHEIIANYLISYLNPNIFVELGVHNGFSYFSFCQSVVETKAKTKCFAVDNWIGDKHAGFHETDVFEKVNSHNNNNYLNFSKLLKMNFDDALNQFKDHSIDLLHIDGLHTYEKVKHDFNTWKPKLSDDAVVLFHDVNEFRDDFGVHKLFDELIKDYKYHIIFPHAHGLGLIQSEKAKKEKSVINSLKENEEIIKIIQFLHNKNQKNLNLTQVTQAKEQEIVNLTQVTQAKDQEIVNLIQVTQAKDQEIVNLIQVTQAKDQEIVNLIQVTQAKDQEINEILNSTCWKITLPIRIIVSFLRRITIFTKKAYEYFLLVKKEIKNKNIINIIKLVIKVFIKSGFNGLKHSLVELKKKNNFSYYQWILDNEILTKDEERFLKNKILNFKYKPLVSIVIPVYNSDIGFLEQAINSVLKQSYNNWELCIADDFSSNKNVSLILKKFEKKDNRIKVVYRKSNGHISEASNSALKIAQGEWITFLDHDDMLNEHALFYIVNSINDNPNIKLIYSDEDKILENTSLRSDPYFKTDWNRELFYGQNYIIHMACYKTDIINAIGGFRVGFEGSQDYDLTLRYIEKIQDHEISHVPRILYHWRISDLSTSKNIQNKKYSVTNGIKALNEHLNRIGIEATTEIVHGQYYKINYSLPKDLPLVTIIIPTKNNYLYLKKCIDSILEKTTYLNYEILIINNNSTDENTLSYLSELSLNYKIQVILDSTSPFNYSLINNSAVTMASGDLICFMNDDTEVISNDWLTEMVSLTLQKNVAFVGCKLLYADNTIQHAGVVLGIKGLAGHAFKYFPSTSPGYFCRALLTSEYSAVTAACTLIKKEIFLKLKGFDPDNLKVAFNDVDICIRAIDKGYRNIFTPFALLYHYESKSRGYDVTSDQKKRSKNEFLYVSKKWYKYIFTDKCYSPNLTLNFENFSYDKSRVPKII